MMVIIIVVVVSSVRSSSVYHGLIEIHSAAAATFSNFSNSSESKVKVKGRNIDRFLTTSLRGHERNSKNKKMKVIK